MEKWKMKAKVFFIIEKIPFGEALYYFIQRNITKSLRPSNDELRKKFRIKVLYPLKMILQYGNIDIEDAKFYEFGAGWNLLSPIGFSFCRSRKSISNTFKYSCIDINRFVHKKEVAEVFSFCAQNKEWIEAQLNNIGKTIRCQNIGLVNVDFDTSGGGVKQLLNNCGIAYYAPCDARKTNFESASFDYIISNTTMELIPKDDLYLILNECHRILNKGGLMCVNINYIDHYTNFDNAINIYNFLKYSSEDWKKFCPTLHYQNRMRHSDYKRMFEKAGFKIINEEINEIHKGDYELLKTITLADEFKLYDIDDLVIRGARFVITKP